MTRHPVGCLRLLASLAAWATVTALGAAVVVLAVNWDGDTLAHWQTDHCLRIGFRESDYTHFYPLAKIQPPAALAPAAPKGAQ